MKLTIEDLSKKTKLSVPTLRVYVSRHKLGTKVGNNRFFSQSDVDKLLKSSKGSRGKTKAGKKAKPAKAAKPTKPARKPAKAAKPARPARKPAKVRAVRKAAPRKTAPVAAVEKPMPAPEKRSFWASLFGPRKPKQKVNLLQAKTTK